MVEPPAVGEPIVCTPPALVYRVSKQGRNPFSPPPWEHALSNGTFGGRFDDPGPASPGTDHFRTVYAASTREAARGESIAQFRPSLAPVAAVRVIDLGVPPELATGIVTTEWRRTRRMGQTEIDGAPRFVDISADRTLTHLRSALASVASALGLVDIDLSAVAGSQRSFTQACARYVYEAGPGDGSPGFAGIRYPSRLHAAWECRAIFSDRLRHVPALPHAIAADDDDLRTAASHLGLSVEGANRV